MTSHALGFVRELSARLRAAVFVARRVKFSTVSPSYGIKSPPRIRRSYGALSIFGVFRFGRRASAGGSRVVPFCFVKPDLCVYATRHSWIEGSNSRVVKGFVKGTSRCKREISASDDLTNDFYELRSNSLRDCNMLSCRSRSCHRITDNVPQQLPDLHCASAEE
ncbi:hypothetical protein EVAR_3589_1 [Eumeta japonica]|uniref:Uncharacterized protein n=1 Tax=Eumeta variegata TaxID=151549 RepID=A0A4C1SZ13_EUMVA|nr:hypothetical protein EVAR_3589_1 [Eumeta japonica]